MVCTFVQYMERMALVQSSNESISYKWPPTSEEMRLWRHTVVRYASNRQPDVAQAEIVAQGITGVEPSGWPLATAAKVVSRLVYLGRREEDVVPFSC